jgi:RNA polymerase sigma-32 factor
MVRLDTGSIAVHYSFIMNQWLDRGTARFIATAQGVPPLRREEEHALSRCARAGDRRAADRLIKAHLRDVVFVAQKHRYYGTPVADLIAEGNLGLLRALEKFEPERGVRFGTYAGYWIRSFIVGYILRSWTLVGGRSGVLSSNLFFRLRRERARLESLHGSSSETAQLLAEKFDVSADELGHMVERLDARDVSLDAPIHPESAATLGDSLTSNSDAERAYDAEKLRRSVAAALQKALPSLDRRERFIAEARLLADTADELSLADIGRELGVSRERVRQLEARICAKLRRALHDECGIAADWPATAA